MKHLHSFFRNVVVSSVVLLPLTACLSTNPLQPFLQKDYIGARQAADVWLEGQNRKKDGLSYRGWADFMLGRYENAYRGFNQLKNIDPKNFDANLGIAWVNIKRGDFDNVEGFLEIAQKKADARKHLDWEAYKPTLFIHPAI